MFIRRVCRKEIVPNKRYAWLLYSENESDPAEKVVLDVTHAEALVIDHDLGMEVRQISKPSTLTRITVLLADDHSVVREGLCSMLEAERDIHVVGEADNGLKAVRMTKRLQPDVVLMDVVMPVINGLKATRQINAQGLKSKVLILSFHSDRDSVRRAIDAGAFGYLVKQSAARDVVHAIREAKKGAPFFSPLLSKWLPEFRSDVLVGNALLKQGDRLLTLRESDVLRMVGKGRSAKQIAAKLSISVKAAERYRREIMHKLDIHTVAALTRYALTTGRVENPIPHGKNRPRFREPLG